SDLFGVRRDRLGLINFAVDADQKVYQLPEFFIRQVLVPQGLGEGVSSFAAATLQAAGRSPTTLDGAIFFYGPPTTFPRVPFWHVLDPTNWAVHQQQGTFKDKIVLIGPTAELFQDFLSTPFSDKMPGIELHANAVATLLEKRDIHDAIPSLPLQGALVFVGIVATGGVILRFKRPVVQFLGALGIAIAWVGVSYLCLTYGSLIVPTAIPFIGIMLTGLSTLVTGTINNQLEQRRLRSTLERYVAAPIVQEILTHYSDDFQSLLKGRRIKAAVLFCDIRSFTTISLHLEPEELVEQLNTYLNAMVEAILDAGGTIDKFIGDAIMAEFGSPISLGEQADAMNAIRAALGMRRSLTVLQEQWQAEGKVVLFNGIGINFGEAIAGDIGSYRRREYALIGDAVNIASRVEGLTRKFWTDILITDSLYQLVKDEVEVVCVGAHELKGRGENKVLLYSLVGLKGDSQEPYQQLHEKLRALTGFEGINKA
ncbi:MAG TPA: adenylate/guanylate cyclase domain-containing protein, partial [Chroococcidiopsis sp.]